ncbi:biopolymer transporter ExbD [Pseudolysobacter antarcticus]|uniref:Biopolymer transporter ExbD n=1 Tax=Pseudolysobacter antarcticus TaxID=2511995 RepID=A0A411HEP4_9GAMM|nr:biopolymer transporter ExbD [Pseudolysobacter antarcticus]QBB68914.1 biopolymer transporter ExbD [Pseudolysobacter antarcticus]
MAFSSGGSGGVMAEINVTPLVDVMLVLLIIFMITAPLAAHKIRVDLPKADPGIESGVKIPPIDLAVNKNGELFLDDGPVTDAQFKARMAVFAQQLPQPELEIRAEKTTQYSTIWSIMSTAKAAGMVHVGFVTTGKAAE